MKNFISFILLVVTSFCYSQSLSRSVISPKGGFDNTDNISLEWTLGESFIETLTKEDVIITQGFQQSYNSRLLEINEYAIHIQIFPNPAISDINVYIDSSINKKLLLSFYDVHGRIVKVESAFTDNQNTVVDISNFSSGVYLLNISDLEGLLIKTHKIIKL